MGWLDEFCCSLGVVLRSCCTATADMHQIVWLVQRPRAGQDTLTTLRRFLPAHVKRICW